VITSRANGCCSDIGAGLLRSGARCGFRERILVAVGPAGVLAQTLNAPAVRGAEHAVGVGAAGEEEIAAFGAEGCNNSIAGLTCDVVPTRGCWGGAVVSLSHAPSAP
jgi:hypothetical protein